MRLFTIAFASLWQAVQSYVQINKRWPMTVLSLILNGTGRSDTQVYSVCRLSQFQANPFSSVVHSQFKGATPR